MTFEEFTAAHKDRTAAGIAAAQAAGVSTVLIAYPISSGVEGFVADIRDQWGFYVDGASVSPNESGDQVIYVQYSW